MCERNIEDAVKRNHLVDSERRYLAGKSGSATLVGHSGQNGESEGNTRMSDGESFALSPVLLERLRAAKRVLALTGAGVSAESGIPTFRGTDGVGFWGRYDPHDLASRPGYERNPQRAWAWYAMRRAQLQSVAPNPAHYALASLGAYYPEFTLVTQNVDGLHERAGSRDVIELHGNLKRFKCLEEDAPVVYADPPDAPIVTEEMMERGEWPAVPPCPGCGGLLRPDVVWFGEMLPAVAFARAEAAAEACEICLVIGTSAEVYPAASLPETAHRRGALIVEVNPETTDLSRWADLSLRGPAGEILPRLVELIVQQA
jgi:NAD-dependent deacetylase